jgi:hypothetical protein
MPATYVNIASTTVGAGAPVTVTLSSIPSTYTDLVLLWSTRGDTTGINFFYTLNGTSTAIYSYVHLFGNGTTVGTSLAGNNNYNYVIGGTNASSYTANTFSNFELYIPNYTSSSNKQMCVRGNTENNATLSYVHTSAQLWRNTSAISSITIGLAGNTNFASGSSFYLYGIKNS